MCGPAPVSNSSGKVYLVGAGPGDEGLITKRGYDLLRKADVVVLDALVNPSLIKSIKAKIINVGKRGPGASSGALAQLPQKKINSMLVDLAKRGKNIVRLKGGDPILFGRGSEELESLRKSGIRYEIVPGVSSATAVPIYAGIPVTDRRWASQVTILTGREGKSDRAGAPRVDWNRLSPQGTLVILMAVSRWPQIQKKLIRSGWRQNKPVAAIEWGTTRNQRTIITTLGKSRGDFKRTKLVAPSIIVVGEVVALSRRLSWLNRERPLLGRRIIVTRASEQSEKFGALLEEKGAEVYLNPSIRIAPLNRTPEVRKIIRRLEKKPRSFDWLVLLSSNAVDNFALALGSRKTIVRKAPILAIGPRTAQAVRNQGWRVAKTARDFNSFGVRETLGSVSGKQILIPRVKNAPQDLSQALRKGGAFVTEISTYQTIPVPPSPEMKQLALDGVDAITFTSGSTVRYFLKYFRPRERSLIFNKALAVSIGPMTTASLRGLGVVRVLETPVSTTEGMVDVLCRFFAPKNSFSS